MNKIKNFSLFATLAFAISFTFFACSGDNGGDDPDNGGISSSEESGKSSSSIKNNDIFSENMQIYTYDNEEWKSSGIVKADLRDENGTDTLITVGTVTDGILKLELPETIPEKWLKTLKTEYKENGNEIEESNISSSVVGAKIFIDDTFLVFKSENDNNPSTLIYTTLGLKEAIMPSYSSKTVKITGSWKYTEPNYLNEQTFDLDYNLGWNKLYLKTHWNQECLKTDCNYTNFSTSSNILTSDLKNFRWFVSESDEEL